MPQYIASCLVGVFSRFGSNGPQLHRLIVEATSEEEALVKAEEEARLHSNSIQGGVAQSWKVVDVELFVEGLDAKTALQSAETWEQKYHSIADKPRPRVLVITQTCKGENCQEILRFPEEYEHSLRPDVGRQLYLHFTQELSWKEGWWNYGDLQLRGTCVAEDIKRRIYAINLFRDWLVDDKNFSVISANQVPDKAFMENMEVETAVREQLATWIEQGLEHPWVVEDRRCGDIKLKQPYRYHTFVLGMAAVAKFGGPEEATKQFEKAQRKLNIGYDSYYEAILEISTYFISSVRTQHANVLLKTPAKEIVQMLRQGWPAVEER